MAGVAVAILAAWYFVILARKSLAGYDLGGLFSGRVIAAAAVLTLAYMVSIPLTAIAWSRLLKALGQPATMATTTSILATTQLGKYLPGNIAHHVGRVVIARARKLETTSTVMSIGYETLLTVVAGAHVSSLTLLWSPPVALANWPLVRYHWLLVAAVTICAASVIVVAPGLSRALIRLRGQPVPADRARGAPQPSWSDCLACYLMYSTNFLLVGGGLWLAAKALSQAPVPISDFVLLVGAFASSWVLGFLAPGAPAGLGIRETVLSLWLGAAFEPPVVVSLVIMLRVATTVGDLLNFAWGSLFLVRAKHAQ